MAHEFSIRFQPASGAKFVQAEAYVQVVSSVLEGLASLRAALAPELAQKHGWGVPQVRDALTFCVGPTGAGSLVVPLVSGGGAKGPPLAADALAREFWREAGSELGRVAKGKAIHLSAAGAEAFARASAAAKDSNAKLSLASRAGRGDWRSLASLTMLEPALRRYANARQRGHRATTSLAGQIVSLTYDPPGFVLSSGAARRSVRMPSRLRDLAREFWGKEVVILTDAIVSAEGGVADIHALEIRLAASAEQASERFDETFGLMRDVWNKDDLDGAKRAVLTSVDERERTDAGWRSGALDRTWPQCVSTAPRATSPRPKLPELSW